LDEERPVGVRPLIEQVADVRSFHLDRGRFPTRCGGLFLFMEDLLHLGVDQLATEARLPGSRMIPAGHALRSSLALKLWSVERKSHVMALVADPGLALFAGLNAIPKKSYLSEYSSRIEHRMTLRLLDRWHRHIVPTALRSGKSFNLDFHSVPYYGEHPIIERHYVSRRSRRQSGVLTFLAQDAEGHAFCYSNADLRKGEEADEILRFIEFWKSAHGERPAHLVFDSRLTTFPNLKRVAEMGITFMTLRRRSAGLLKEIRALPPSAWRRVRLDVPTRRYKTPRVYENKVSLLRDFTVRQLFIEDLGHDEPTILITNDYQASVVALITRYAQRMLIENALSDAVRFFHMDALSSHVGMKVDFDMALLVIASGLYRLMARRMRGYHDAQARHIFHDLIDMPADIDVTDSEVRVRFHRRAHLPIVVASGLLDRPIPVPWWQNRPVRLLA